MKNKIVFAGVMGAILMSVGANAATTSVATKGYVDQQVGGVQANVTQLSTTVNNIGDNYITMTDVTDAIDRIDLSAYQITNNMVQTLKEVAAADAGTKYPSVAAVSSAITEAINGLGLSEEQITALQALITDDGVVSQLNTLKTDVAGLKEDVSELTGDGANSVATQIANALEASQANWSQTDADAADFIKNKPTDLVTATALESTLGDYAKTSDLTSAIDGLNGKDGTVTKITETVNTLETVIGDSTDGLVADVAANTSAIAENAAAIAENAEDIAANTAAIANKITMPAACASGNQTCVLMVTNGTVSWAPVTSPVEDGKTTITETTAE